LYESGAVRSGGCRGGNGWCGSRDEGGVKVSSVGERGVKEVGEVGIGRITGGEGVGKRESWGEGRGEKV